MSEQVTPLFLKEANEMLQDKDVMTILTWAKDTFGMNEISMTTAFGYSGIVLLHHVIAIMPRIQLYFIDTGFHFQETLEFCDFIQKKWDLNLTILHPELTRDALTQKLGDQPYETNPDLCCHYCKVEPLLNVLPNHLIWLSGLRRDQSRTRAEIEIIEVDGRGKIKLSPLAFWSREQTWDYIKDHGLPYHPLYDQGYPSIGCEPCTVPVDEGGDERDGRWPFMQKMECGIHLY